MVPSDKISRHLGLHGTEHQQLRPTAGSDGASMTWLDDGYNSGYNANNIQ